MGILSKWGKKKAIPSTKTEVVAEVVERLPMKEFKENKTDSIIPEWMEDAEKTQEVELEYMKAEKTFSDDNILVSLLPKETMQFLSTNPIIDAYKSISVPVVDFEKWKTFSSDEISANFNKIREENEILITKMIPDAKERAMNIAKKIISRVPTIQLETTRILRKTTDQKLSIYRREVNLIRGRTSDLTTQLKTIIQKFKTLETSLSKDSLSDRVIMKSLSGLSTESAKRINENLDGFSKSNINTQSQSMYKNVLQALRKVILGVKSDIDLLKSKENDILEKMKDVELKFQFKATEVSNQLQSVEINVEKEIRNSNAFFELTMERTAIIVSKIQKKYNEKLISLEEDEFQGRIDNLVRSIEVSKLGIDYMREIDAIEQEIEEIDTSRFSMENVNELTQEVEMLVGKESEK
ncbi:MAG: hypothetical protein KAG14_01005 [Mycoplasmataceae bacterium]|nr:hypothetical protein [Mycoplasmataceae bacterium]